jgi:hypothetical protein
MSSSESNEAYDTLIKLWDKLTCLKGMIILEAVNILEDKPSGIFTMAKTHHYTQGQKYGHLASAITESNYRLVIGNATWTHTVPTKLRSVLRRCPQCRQCCSHTQIVCG